MRATHGVNPQKVAQILWDSPTIRSRIIKRAKEVGFNPLTGANSVKFVCDPNLDAYIVRAYRVWCFRSLRSQNSVGSRPDLWIAPFVLQDWAMMMAPPQEVLACFGEILVAEGGKRALDRAAKSQTVSAAT